MWLEAHIKSSNIKSFKDHVHRSLKNDRKYITRIVVIHLRLFKLVTVTRHSMFLRQKSVGPMQENKTFCNYA